MEDVVPDDVRTMIEKRFGSSPRPSVASLEDRDRRACASGGNTADTRGYTALLGSNSSPAWKEVWCLDS